VAVPIRDASDQGERRSGERTRDDCRRSGNPFEPHPFPFPQGTATPPHHYSFSPTDGPRASPRTGDPESSGWGDRSRPRAREPTDMKVMAIRTSTLTAGEFLLASLHDAVDMDRVVLEDVAMVS